MDISTSTPSGNTLSASEAPRNTSSPTAQNTLSTLPDVPAAEEQSFPLLIHTCMDGRRIKLYKDDHGLFELSVKEGSTEIVKIKPSSSYAEVIEAINIQIPELSNERERAMQRVPQMPRVAQMVQAVAFSWVYVLWDLPGGGTGSTRLDEGNCGKVLETISYRGWRDMLLAIYKQI